MATMKMTVEMHFRIVEKLHEASECWTDAQREAFSEDYDRLVSFGCLMADVRIIGKRVVAHPSDDFMQLLAKWGVFP